MSLIAQSRASFPATNTYPALLWLLLYLGMHFALRLAMSGSLELDEAEQLVLAQSLSWGYGEQPPLYTWLQWGLFQLLGPGVLALALLKYALLALLYTCTYLSARRLLPTPHLALLAAFSLLLIPSFAWESLRDLTHSVLVTALSALSFYAVLRVAQEGRVRDYALLGLALGLGALAKYSYALFAAALLLAALSLPRARARLFNMRMLVTLAIAAVIVAPHAVWLLGHWDAVLGFVREESAAGVSVGWLAGVGKGVGSLAGNLAAFLTPLWLVWALVLPQGYQRRALRHDLSPWFSLLQRFFLALIVVLAVAILIFGVTRFQERWLQPLVFLLPIYFLGRVPVTVPERRLRVYGTVIVLFAVLVMAGRAGQQWLGPLFGSTTRLHLPFAELASALRSAGFRAGTLVAGDGLTAGGLHLYLPHTRTVSAGTPDYLPPPLPSPGQCLLVWDASKHEEMPRALQTWLGPAARALVPDMARYIEAPLRYAPSRHHRLGYVLWPADAGLCR